MYHTSQKFHAYHVNQASHHVADQAVVLELAHVLMHVPHHVLVHHHVHHHHVIDGQHHVHHHVEVSDHVADLVDVHEPVLAQVQVHAHEVDVTKSISSL